MPFNPEQHHRRSIRLDRFDYSQVAHYFVTVCAVNRTPIFGEIVDGVLHPSNAGRIVMAEWDRTPLIRPEVVLGEFALLPDHLHGIIVIQSNLVGAHRRAPKTAVTREWGDITAGERWCV